MDLACNYFGRFPLLLGGILVFSYGFWFTFSDNYSKEIQENNPFPLYNGIHELLSLLLL
jgi:hypothetical protein